VIHPMQYELERVYHLRRQQAAAQQRRVAEAKRHITTHSQLVRLAGSVATQLHWNLVRGTRALALARRQVG
jgi:DNA-binding protein H-NS